MQLQEQATIVYRAIHTLERLAMVGDVTEGTLSGSFCSDSWQELKRLLDHFKAEGIADIDIGAYIE